MLEEILEQIFWRAAIHYNPRKIPNIDEIRQVVKILAETMREMRVTIIPDNLLKQ